MRTSRLVLQISVLLLATSLSPSYAFGQENKLPPQLNQNSTIEEILEYLNQTSFPYARIGLKSSARSKHSRYSPYIPSDGFSETMIFSQGFKLVGDRGCHIRLVNDDAKLLNYSSDDIAAGVGPSTKGIPLPYGAEFATRLDTVSYDKGKSPFLHTRKLDEAKLLGSWRTEFTSRGFFTRAVFGIKFPLKEHQDQYISTPTATFTFDDKAASERFNAAFRLLIKRCQPQSTKRRWAP